jgi:hypothetical protein
MSIQLQAPNRHTGRIDTAIMASTMERTVAVHHQHGLVVWTGPSRVGKTTTARYMRDLLNAQASGPQGFTAVHFEVGGVGRWSGNEQKKALRSVHHATLGRVDEGRYNRALPEEAAGEIVTGLEQRNIQMIFVDEAGCLSVNALRAFALLCDTARNMDFSLTIVLVGMDDLAAKLRSVEQVYNRVIEWCYFEPYTIDETWAFLRAMHPHFRTLQRGRHDDDGQVEMVHQRFGGLPGLMAPFLRRLDYWRPRLAGDSSFELVRTVILMTDTDESKCAEAEGLRAGGQHATPRWRLQPDVLLTVDDIAQGAAPQEKVGGKPVTDAVKDNTQKRRRGRPPKGGGRQQRNETMEQDNPQERAS